MMIELKHDRLVFSFPEVHADAVLHVEFQRTLRIPDDDRDYPLPPGLGAFPLRHVDDFGERVPAKWIRRGGVMLPMYQSEAMWLNFTSPNGYPFAVKVGTGKINAVTGDAWSDDISRRPRQDYLSIPAQPWLDGYCVAEGFIRQFVAMPLGAGYSVEEQLTGSAEHGGLQLLVHPLKASAYRPRPPMSAFAMDAFAMEGAVMCMEAPASYDMGLAPGGRMEQEIYDDPQRFTDWDTRHVGRCFVHLTNAMVWRAITGEDPPTVPPTAAEYNRAGLPWFEYYGADHTALAGGDRLKKVRTVAEIGKSKGDVPLPENESLQPGHVVGVHAPRSGDEVRSGTF
jgi:hypothetical protein